MNIVKSQAPSVLIASDRIKAVLDYWFTNTSWDRHSKAPEILFTQWFGMKYDPEKKQMRSLAKEEQEIVDKEIEEKFLTDLRQSAIKEEGGYFNSWRHDKQGVLALIILQDQMARNIFRKKPEAFAFDTYTLELMLDLIQTREDKKYKFYERLFLYLPFEHSENLAHQDLCFELIKEMSNEFEGDEVLKKVADYFLNFSEQHRNIIKKFGRFPHRNEILDRVSTEEEVVFLKEGGSRFGS